MTSHLDFSLCKEKKNVKVFKSASLIRFPYKFSTSCPFLSSRVNFNVNLISSKAGFRSEYMFGGHESTKTKWNIQSNFVVVFDLFWWFYIITIYCNYRIFCVSITTFAFTFPKLKIEIWRNEILISYWCHTILFLNYAREPVKKNSKNYRSD